jgi:L,D-transpeptidase YbiS
VVGRAIEGMTQPFPASVVDACRRLRALGRERGMPVTAWLLAVDVSTQQMWLADRSGPLRDFSVSTSNKGLGSRMDSWQTPPGWHRVAQRIGRGRPLGSVYSSRRFTGEILPPRMWKGREGDKILSRILWLEGLESGTNRGGKVDSRTRYIYIHGTNHEHRLGSPASNGCIRMGNRDIGALFDEVAGRPVWCWIGERQAG